ncbi:arginine utilization regulatory protein [Sedimentibacter acidaminivorans]|jgi:arginine utilization regulatory protein|uniref:Arginine utilization regulatory protein n=1 Tax=Sedimentibacter acidaminivorans TaxID=913099 RepID=A0ABS4GEC9_9FIRM|nr:sigma 54-interacting transcriptional regulator [Sedimentibacter acidaminivorans]MBP1926056.1 arginine utilization regulatory protein [Sedimentibacter acidaminivorans]
MELNKNLFNGKGYIDGITIIDIKGEILFTAKFNNKLNSENNENYEVVGKNFLDVYENLNNENSSTYKSMQLGVPLYIENQILKSKGKKEIKITSLSVPIKSGNKIVGAIDLSVSENDDKNSEDNIEIDSEIFEKNNMNKLNSVGNQAKYVAESIITNNARMLELKNHINVVADCDLPTMIYGETGTGKELFAQSIHNASKRKEKPFISQNCAAIPDTLLESILFGTSKGAFTGAVDNKGLLELADGGTLFLDEINSMPLHLQSKLLRVLQDGTFRSIGAKESKSVDIKVIAALNEEPLKAIERGYLRRDIYYRLSVLNINIPPLRDRKDDIPLLVSFNVAKYNKVFNKNIKYVSNKLYDKLRDYDWPGNIRELENVIIHGLSVVDKTKEKLEFRDIEDKYNELIQFNEDVELKIEPLTEMVNNYERCIIEKTLKHVEYNVTKASKLLNIPRQTLQRKAKQYNLI